MILIVDDKQENLFSLKSLLQLHGYEVDTAQTGEEALKKVLRYEYALLILDVQMPGMDGFEVAEAINGYSKTRSTPIIFLSAVNTNKPFITKGYNSGGIDYITKPFDPDLLMLKVNTFYRLYQQTKELRTIQEDLRKEIEGRKEAQKKLEEMNQLLEDKVNERTRELMEMNQVLEKSNVELQQYASIASHDLQEPLRKIITFINIIQDKYLSQHPETSVYFKKAIASAERMRNLINDLLDYSKLSAASYFKETNLAEILESTLSDLELSIQERGAEIRVGKLPSVEVIPGQIRQVFQNIISNALKFSRKDVKPLIEIWSEECLEEDRPDRVHIYIRDNGIGFNEAYLHKIFNLFQRLHGINEYEGTGIGLAIVRKIMDQHHGSITARSTEGEGSTFIIELPLKQKSVTATASI